MKVLLAKDALRLLLELLTFELLNAQELGRACRVHVLTYGALQRLGSLHISVVLHLWHNERST